MKEYKEKYICTKRVYLDYPCGDTGNDIFIEPGDTITTLQVMHKKDKSTVYSDIRGQRVHIPLEIFRIAFTPNEIENTLS